MVWFEFVSVSVSQFFLLLHTAKKSRFSQPAFLLVSSK
nr:MAG TPA: hypothetical protein [Caudoviricetes sp.]